MSQPTVATVSDATFDDVVIRSEMPVLVEFGASWCGPCRLVAPVLEQIARDEADRLRVVTLDVDESPATARSYDVLGMPTMVLFRDGRPVARVVGARPRTAILQQLEPHLDRPRHTAPYP